jgi:hypothetical protein
VFVLAATKEDDGNEVQVGNDEGTLRRLSVN